MRGVFAFGGADLYAASRANKKEAVSDLFF